MRFLTSVTSVIAISSAVAFVPTSPYTSHISKLYMSSTSTATDEVVKDEKREKSIKAETFQRARLQAQVEQMAKNIAAAVAEEGSVDYDANARLAFEASGASGDFDAYKTQYFEDTSAMIAKKHQDTIAAEKATAEAAAAEKAAVEKATAEAATAEKAAAEKAAAEAAAAEKAAAEKAAAEAAAAEKAAAEKAAVEAAAAEKAAAEKAAAEAAAAEKAAAEKAAAEAAAAEKAAAEKAAVEAAAAKEVEEKRLAEEAAAVEAERAAKEADDAAAKELGYDNAEIMKVRQQPKSPEEEAALATKYGALDLGEKAFTILVDLGMVDLNPDPDDANRDTSKDDEDLE